MSESKLPTKTSGAKGVPWGNLFRDLYHGIRKEWNLVVAGMAFFFFWMAIEGLVGLGLLTLVALQEDIGLMAAAEKFDRLAAKVAKIWEVQLPDGGKLFVYIALGLSALTVLFVVGVKVTMTYLDVSPISLPPVEDITGSPGESRPGGEQRKERRPTDSRRRALGTLSGARMGARWAACAQAALQRA